MSKSGCFNPWQGYQTSSCTHCPACSQTTKASPGFFAMFSLRGLCCIFYTVSFVPLYYSHPQQKGSPTPPPPKDSQAVKIFKAAGIKDVVNVSQQIDRMHLQKPGVIPCITPKSLLYDLSRDRLLVPAEKFMLMGFPIDALDLSNLTPRDS